MLAFDPVWDGALIDDILRVGGLPYMNSVDSVFKNPISTLTVALCTFLTPKGDAVGGVQVSAGFLRAKYPHMRSYLNTQVKKFEREQRAHEQAEAKRAREE